MFYTYILFSKTKGKYYIGSTCDLNARVIRHNQKSKGFTGNVNDWELVYSEQFSDREGALKREKQIKGWKSSKMIAVLIGSEHPDF